MSETEIPDDELPTDVLAVPPGATAEMDVDAVSAFTSDRVEPLRRVTAPLTLPKSSPGMSAQMAIHGQLAVEYLRELGAPLVDHYVLEILDREAAKPHPSLWHRRYVDLLLFAQDRLGDLLPVDGPYLDARSRRHLASEILYLADSTASIVVSYRDVSAEQHIVSAYKGWFAADATIAESLGLDDLDARRKARQARLDLFRAELDSIKNRLYESFLVNITLPLGQLVASLDRCETPLQRDFYLGMVAYGSPLSLIGMGTSSAEVFPREQIGEFEFDLVLRDREVSETSTRQRVAVTLVNGPDQPGGPSDAAESLRELEARDRERALARYGWTGLVFTARQVAADLRGCVEQACQAYLGPLPDSVTRSLRRSHSRRFST